MTTTHAAATWYQIAIATTHKDTHNWQGVHTVTNIDKARSCAAKRRRDGETVAVFVVPEDTTSTAVILEVVEMDDAPGRCITRGLFKRGIAMQYPDHDKILRAMAGETIVTYGPDDPMSLRTPSAEEIAMYRGHMLAEDSFDIEELTEAISDDGVSCIDWGVFRCDEYAQQAN